KAIAAIGLGLALRELVVRARSPERRPADPTPPRILYLVLGGVLVVYLALLVLGSIASHGNPFDDYVGYLALTRRMLDCGDLIEPFSFRRISAYGGQTALHALVALRGDVASGDLLDTGMFQAIAVLVIVDLARRRRLHVAATALIVAFVASLPDLSINAAATWTGVAMFLCAYSLASDPARDGRALVLTFAVCAGACTLRQNYLLPAGGFAALLLVFQARARAAAASWRTAWAEQRGTAALCVAVAAGVLVPYAIATWRSNATFLYPLVLGTANPAAPLRPTGFTVFDELSFWFAVALDTEPIRIWWVLAPFMLVARDARAARPWAALLIASVVGFAVLVHSFALSDTATLWRYGFGYMTPLAVVFLIEAGARLPLVDPRDQPEPQLRLPALAVFFVWLAVLTQFVQARVTPERRIALLAENVPAGLARGTEKAGDPALYRELQAALPEGARVAVLLDDPYLLDYGRNDIVNLDLPGFAAPRPGLPSFLGAERWRGYLRSLGIRYAAFVDGEFSSYLFRRRSWVPRIFTDSELFRFMGAHMVDALDSLRELARTSRVVFHRAGITAIDLGEPVPADAADPARDEPERVRQDAFIRHLAETELHNAAWQLASRRDVVFVRDGAGPSVVQVELPETTSPFTRSLLEQVTGKPLPPPPPCRWLSERTHVRVLGSGRHHLHVALRVDVARLASIPSARLSIDGAPIGRASPDAQGYLGFDAAVSCTGWCDVYVVFSTASEYWASAESVRGIQLLGFDWTSEPR
ncbi:MAG TPA: hypothetical protein VF516_22670, partial [Kofleriaceae bacterium]